MSLSSSPPQTAATVAVKSGMVSRPSENYMRLTEKPNVLSIDCGTTNFCYCLVEDITPYEDQQRQGGGKDKNDIDFQIKAWEKLELNATDMKEMTNSLVSELDKRPWMLAADHVVIEGQIADNAQMLTLSHVVQCYFVCRTRAPPRARWNRPAAEKKPNPAPTVDFVRAGAKFMHMPAWVKPYEPKTDNVRENAKLKAVRIAHEILKEKFGSCSPEFEYLLSHYKKADDLADSFLQALFYLKVLATRRNTKKFVANILAGIPNAEEERADAPDNRSWEKQADAELPNHLVFRAPQFRQVIIDMDRSVLALPETIARQTMP